MSVSPRVIILLSLLAIIPVALYITTKNEPVSVIAILNVLIITVSLFLLTGPAQTTESPTTA